MASKSDHSEASHQNALAELCRLCAKRAQTAKEKKRNVVHQVSKVSDLILEVFGVSTSHDMSDTHPALMCSQCYKMMSNVKRRGQSSAQSKYIDDVKETDMSIWKSYNAQLPQTQCTVCSFYFTQSKGGRPAKLKSGKGANYWRLTDKFDHLLSDSLTLDPQSFDLVGLPETLKHHFVCSLCNSILSSRSVSTQCGHDFCSHCLSGKFPDCLKRTQIPCPKCNEPVVFDTVVSLKMKQPKIYCQLLDLQVRCKLCKFIGTLSNLQEHKCHSPSPSTSSASDNKRASKVEVGESLGKPVEHQSSCTANTSTCSAQDKTEESSPQSVLNEKLLTRAIKAKLQQSEDKMTLRLATGGQPIYLVKVPVARTPSDSAKSPRKRARSKFIRKVRTLASAGVQASAVGAAEAQLASELKVLSKKTRESVCKRAGIRQRCQVTKEVGLMIKSHVKLSWAQKRKLTRILRVLGVRTESEVAQRELRKNLIGDHLEGCNMIFEFRDEDNPQSVNGLVGRKAPCVYIKDLPAFVTEHLEKYAEEKRLIWHEQIPKDEIWVKIGGDHGGGSFKMCFQIVNVEKPNSAQNTVVFCCFLAPDSYVNLSLALSRFDEQVKALNGLQWRDKTICVFQFGDYDAICKLAGLSGAAGTHPCYYCLITREQMQRPRRLRDKARARDLDNIEKDHADFIQNGGNLKKQAQYHNAVHAPIFKIPVNSTCPPYLHVLLGIIKKHHDLLEAACHKLDVDVATDKAKKPGNLSDQLFDEYVLAVREKAKLQGQIAKLDTKIEDLEENSSLATMLRNATKIDKLKAKKLDLSAKVEALCKVSNLKAGSGPVAASLDVTLQKHNIRRQKYHGKSFVGNDCNKYLQKEVFRDVCASIVSKTEELTQSPSIRAEAIAVKTKFHSLFTMYSKIHKLISHSHPVNQQQLSIIQDQIDEYMAYYRGIFPAVRIILKQHLLEDHVVPWMREWGFGLGLHGEQGGESIHAQFNEISANSRGIVCPLKRTVSVLQDHLTLISPTIQSKQPKIAKRKQRDFRST